MAFTAKMCACSRELALCSQCIAELVEGQKPSTNSDYAAALRVHAEWLSVGSNWSFPTFCKAMSERLHSDEPNVA